MPKHVGALPAEFILEMIEGRHIRAARAENIRPSSLDLTLSAEVYRIEGIFQPRPGERVREILKDIGALPHDLRYPLERNVTYIALLEESLVLPENVYAYCNPKSSTGRNDVQVRVIADGVPRYDAAAPAGFQGELWIAVSPKSYPVRIPPGETLSQMRFFTRDTRFDEAELEVALSRHRLLWSTEGAPFSYRDLLIRDNDGSVILTVDVRRDPAGWECLGSERILDFAKRKFYAAADFFRPLPRESGRIRLREGGFYILYTRERVRVPPHLACEMAPMDERSGEFRSHYAGYIDPGWGFGKDGEGVGRRLVLEVRPFEDLVLRDNQPVAKIKFERMYEAPEAGYDALAQSNYTEESPLPPLSKHFKDVSAYAEVMS